MLESPLASGGEKEMQKSFQIANNIQDFEKIIILAVSSTWVEQNDGTEAAQLCFVHLHISHFVDELSENPE